MGKGDVRMRNANVDRWIFTCMSMPKIAFLRIHLP
ncbi:unnamed protein product [Brassica oleracea]